MTEQERTIWCGNLSGEVTDEILYELFLQAGPLERVHRPRDKETGERRLFAFVTYEDEETVPYALELYQDTQLYGRSLRLQPQGTESKQRHQQLQKQQSVNRPNVRGSNGGGSSSNHYHNRHEQQGYDNRQGREYDRQEGYRRQDSYDSRQDGYNRQDSGYNSRDQRYSRREEPRDDLRPYGGRRDDLRPYGGRQTDLRQQLQQLQQPQLPYSPAELQQYSRQGSGSGRRQQPREERRRQDDCRNWTQRPGRW